MGNQSQKDKSDLWNIRFVISLMMLASSMTNIKRRLDE